MQDLEGIDFTVSAFITLLEFDERIAINESKISIMVASLIAGITGYTILDFCLRKN